MWPYLLSFVLSVSVLSLVTSGEELDWWQTTVVYEVYAKSFKDSDGDGEGDLRGIIEKMEHIKNTGSGTFWITPIYPSPGADAGYDITNHTEIDPSYGTMEDFEELLDKANTLDLKVVLDLVPNHVSNESEWFIKSVQKIEPYTDYFVWADPKYNENGSRVPPNNWLSCFGGSAWDWNEERQQYYYHKFFSHQPDLNLRHEPVKEEIKNVMKFWLDKGVHGFRIDALVSLYEDVHLRDEPLAGKEDVHPSAYDYLDHIYTIHQPETLELIHQWREFVGEYKKKDGFTRVLIGEGASEIADNIFIYYGTKERPGVHINFNNFLLDVMKTSADAYDYKYTINSWQEHSPYYCWPNWLTGNHDKFRVASQVGAKMVDSVNAVLLWLPGTAISYYGEEIGMEDTPVDWELMMDPAAFRNGPRNNILQNRYDEKAPFQWDNTTSAGFSTSNHTWLPVNSNYKELNLQAQIEAEESHYKVYQQLVAERKAKTLQRGRTIVEAVTRDVFVLVRSLEDEDTYILVVNLGNKTSTVNLTASIPGIPSSALVVVASVGSGFTKGQRMNTSEVSLASKYFVGLKGSAMTSTTAAAYKSHPKINIELAAIFLLYATRLLICFS